MIVTYNVCDHCGTQKQIMSGSAGGIDVLFAIDDTYESTRNPTRFRQKDLQGTFCDKECFISWLKENLNTRGFVKERIQDDS
jgi:predicted dinucleotide-utilizing enzyme